MTDYQVMRDYWDRPIVFPQDVEPPYVGEWKDGRDRAGRPKRWFSTKQGVGYGRASSAGKALDSKDGLVDWAACQAAVGVLLDDGARSEVTTLINEYDGDPWYQGDDGGTRSGKQRLKDAVERARNTAGANTRASAGTEMHKLGEMVNQGKKPRIVQEHLRAPLREYVSAVSKVNFIHQELFVVNDALKRAGSVDYLMELPAGLATPDGIKHDEPIVVVGDLKGLPLDTKIPTPNGWSTMSALKVGDQVFGSDGKPCMITAKSNVKRIGTKIVRFDDGSSVVCDTEHLWWTVSGPSRSASEQVLPIGVIERTLTDKYLSKQHRVPVAAPLDLPDVKLPVDPYLLGVWLGDGNRCRGVVTKSDELFELIKSDGHELGVRYADKRSGCPSRTVLGLQASLKQSGLLKNKHIPSEYFRSGYNQRLRLLQGLMDTDGTWNIARQTAVFNSTDKGLALGVEHLLLTLGQRPCLSEYQSSGFGVSTTAYSVEFNPVGESFEPFRLDSKRNKVNPKSNVRSTRRMIIAVDEGPDVETVCIAVDSVNSTYLCTEKFIPTHNTGKWDADRPMSVTCQLTVYGRGFKYDQETNTRSPLHPRINNDWGVMVHFPIMSADPRVKFYWVDLNLGQYACELSNDVEDLRKRFERKASQVKEFVL